MTERKSDDCVGREIRTNRYIMFVFIIIVVILFAALFVMRGSCCMKVICGDDTSAGKSKPGGETPGGPGPIYSGKIKKPTLASGDLEWIIELEQLNLSTHAGASEYLQVDLMERDVDSFDSTYTYDDGSGTILTNNYDITSTTVKIDNDGDGVFEPADGEVELEISTKSCPAGTCLEWKNKTAGITFRPCYRSASDGSPVCTNRGIAQELFGALASGSWTVVRSSSTDPTPIEIQSVSFAFN